jgi:hypothetical protein
VQVARSRSLLLVTSLLALSAALWLCVWTSTPVAAATPGLVSADGERLVLEGETFLMKGFNYIPRDYGWTSMADWDWEQVEAELALAREYGANTIRTGFEYHYLTGDVYGERPFTAYRALPEYLDAIERFLSIADSHGFKVVFWLGAGPAWGPLWDPANYGIIEKHLESLIPRFAGDPRIAAWDLATDLDGTMLQLPPAGAYGTDPRATRANMVTLLKNMAGTVRRLDPDHLLTVGFCWTSSSLLTQDFTDFLMPQFLGADAPNILVADEAARHEEYSAWVDYSTDPEGAVGRLVAKIEELRAGAHRPLPIVLAEFGSPTEGEGYSPTFQRTVYQAVLEAAFLRAHVAGALNWTLTDFTWPPKAFTTVPGELSAEERSFGILDATYAPKPAAAVARAYFSDSPQLSLALGPAGISFSFESSMVPALVHPSSSDTRELCAAFDWIELRGQGGEALLRVDVGTAEARSYLLRGFFADEGPWAGDADDFAWAGGPSKTAQVALQLPPEAHSVAFRCVSETRQRVTVSVGEDTVGSVTITPGWRTYTVDLPHSGPPTAGGTIALHGSLSLPISEGDVTIQTSVDGSAWTDGPVLAPKRGEFAGAVRLGQAGQVLVRAVWSGSGSYGMATSEPVEVTVAAAPTTEPPGTTSPATPETALPQPAAASDHAEYIAVGAGLAVVLAAAAAFIVLRRRRRPR